MRRQIETRSECPDVEVKGWVRQAAYCTLTVVVRLTCLQSFRHVGLSYARHNHLVDRPFYHRDSKQSCQRKRFRLLCTGNGGGVRGMRAFEGCKCRMCMSNGSAVCCGDCQAVNMISSAGHGLSDHAAKTQ